MVADPRQKQDLADQYPEVVATLRADIDRWYADVTKDSPPRVPIPIGYEVDPAIDLKAPDSHLHGTISVAGNRPSDINWIHDWTSTDDHAWWDVDVVRGGQYEVLLTHSNPRPGPPVTMRAEVAGESIEAVLPISGTPKVAKQGDVDRVESTKTAVAAQATQKLGQLQLVPGRARFFFRVLNAPGGGFQLNGFTLKRIDP